MIVSKTPLRMSFAGGGSDIGSFYEEHGGAVLSTTVDKYIYVNVNRKFDNDIRLSYSTTEIVDKVSKLAHPIVKNTLDYLGILGGIEISSLADIPSKGSGLGSSSSFTVGLLNALHAYQNKYISKDQLGEISCKIEIDLCGEPIGKQDQYAAAYGGLNLIKFHRNGSVAVDPIICHPNTLADFEKSIIVFYTSLTRSASAILSTQSEGMRSSQKKQNTMKQMVQLTYDLKYLLESGDLDPIGELLDKNWNLKRQMTNGISNSQIDEWYNKGIKAGAKGGKLLGAGNGGFIMFYAPESKHKDISKALKELREVPFSFDENGSQIIHYQPSAL